MNFGIEILRIHTNEYQLANARGIQLNSSFGKITS
jgi:hypothetical protein